MLKDKKICFFCSSSDHIDNRYFESAKEAAEAFSNEGCALVFGGGMIGLMGVISGVFDKSGCRIISVIPEKLNKKGVVFERSSEIIETPTMSERKRIMEEISDAFIALPGGFGTIEEIMEIVTLKQLGYHDKPVVFFNTYGFYDNLLAQIEKLYDERFVDISHKRLYFVTDSPDEMSRYIKDRIG